jgi:DNA repair protein RecN (Recombination protein N)
MLVKLYVQNYALIRELDLGFKTGLTVITGETGAGKSILLGALSLVLGTRADTNVLLDKTVKCVVEGTFRIKEYDLEEFFTVNELDYSDTTILRREINPAGKSRAFINDTPVNINLLKELGEKLIDVHSQHQTLMLNESSFQLNVIDSFAGNGKLRSDYKNTFSRYRKINAEYLSLLEVAEKNKTDLEYYWFQLSQLESAKLVKGEQEELEREQEMLSHTEEINLALSTVTALMTSDENSVLKLLGEVKQQLSKIREFLPEADTFFTRAGSAYIELDDLATEVNRISSKIDADPGRLKFVNERLDLIYSLTQKHRVKDLHELLLRMEELQNLVNAINSGDERLNELAARLEMEKSVLAKTAGEISERRKKVIPDVESEISSLLRQLGMPNARFKVELTTTDDFKPTGTDDADFLFSANKQVKPENLAKVASGGELSRVMLSLKSLLTLNTSLPTIIFDEIDSGVSGEVADKVGQILSSMGRYMQVINITHLPQVAAKGDEHYHVYKDDTKNSTITRVRLLSSEERVQEIARLLSGSEVTPTAIKNAQELLKAGRENS